jgi:peptidoglycan lytic transglycosylase F
MIIKRKTKLFSIISIIISISFLLIFTGACDFKINNKKKLNDPKGLTTLEKIKKRGKIVALTDYNSTSYFIYRGTPMGFQYDMLKMLAEHLGVNLEIIVSSDLEGSFEKLQKHDCDLIAINLTITKERTKLVDFTQPVIQTRQVLIQRKPDDWKKMTRREIDEHLIRNQLDIAGKTVYVQSGSSFIDRLHNLSDEIGDSINIVPIDNYETEQLITLVAKGEIDYTVADENVALINKTYYPQIDVKTAISFPQNLAWAINKESDDFSQEINKWLENIKGTAKYAVIYNKYFKNVKAARRQNSDYLSVTGGKISKFDEAIKKHSKEIGWDWRLLASMIYQESRFNPKIKSWAGAFGLMQLMPLTAQRFGASRYSSPEEQIDAGTDFIKWLDKQLIGKIPDEEERIKFILASYNVGLGHIQDAMTLAEKNGKDPYIWNDNVDYYVLNKSNPKYYRDPDVKYGYCRGQEPYDYVIAILERYEHYQNAIEN